MPRPPGAQRPVADGQLTRRRAPRAIAALLPGVVGRQPSDPMWWPKYEPVSVWTARATFPCVSASRDSSLMRPRRARAQPFGARFDDHLLGLYIDAKDAGKVLGSRFAFVLSPIRAAEPDVAFVRRERRHLLGDHGTDGGPDIAIEVVSRDSRDRDHGEKRRLDQDAGVSEYWIMDPLRRRAEFHRLQEGRYELVPLEANRTFRSTAQPGFFLDVAWLFADPLPKAQAGLGEVLAASA